MTLDPADLQDTLCKSLFCLTKSHSPLKMHHLRSRCTTSVQLFAQNLQTGVRALVTINQSNNHYTTLVIVKRNQFYHTQWEMFPKERYNQRQPRDNLTTANLCNGLRRNIHDSSVVSFQISHKKLSDIYSYIVRNARVNKLNLFI